MDADHRAGLGGLSDRSFRIDLGIGRLCISHSNPCDFSLGRRDRGPRLPPQFAHCDPDRCNAFGVYPGRINIYWRSKGMACDRAGRLAGCGQCLRRSSAPGLCPGNGREERPAQRHRFEFDHVQQCARHWTGNRRAYTGNYRRGLVFYAQWDFLFGGHYRIVANEITAASGVHNPASPWQQLVSGVQYTAGNREISALILLSLVFSIFGISYSTVLPAFVEKVLHQGAMAYGWVNAASGLGAVSGAFLLAHHVSNGRRGQLLVLTNIAFPLILIAFSFTSFYPLSLVLAFGLGVGFMVQFTTINTLLQTRVEDKFRGRVMGLYTITFFGFAPFGNLTDRFPRRKIWIGLCHDLVRSLLFDPFAHCFNENSGNTKITISQTRIYEPNFQTPPIYPSILETLSRSLILLTSLVFLDLSIPRLIQRIIDQGITANNQQVVIQTALVMIGISIVSTMIAVGNNILSVQVGESIARDLRDALFTRIQTFSYGNLDEQKTGQLMVRLTSDTTAVQRVAQISLRIGTRAPLLMIGSLILMINTSRRSGAHHAAPFAGHFDHHRFFCDQNGAALPIGAAKT